MKDVAIFYGGVSVEHDVSIITGVMTVNAVDKSRYNAIPIFVDKTGLWYTGEVLKDIDFYKNINRKKLTQVTLFAGGNTLYKISGKKLKPLCVLSVAINCMHGERGEDGSLAGFLNMCNLPLASPDVAPSSVCIDKCFTKTVMKGLGVQTLPCVVVSSPTDKVLGNVEFPVVVKPNRLGSSIGIKRVDSKDDLFFAVSDALRYGEKALIEPCLTGFVEINCACYKGVDGKIVVSECERPVGNAEILSFDDKYKSGKRVFPADINAKLSKKIKETTEKVYRGLGVDGVIRIDYFVVDGKVFLNEINTVPGSLAYYLFKQTIKGFSEVITELIVSAERRFARGSTFKKSFDTSILNMAGAKGKNSCKN